MPYQPLVGTPYSAADKLDALRDRLISDGFKKPDDIRAYINRFITENPQEVRGRGDNVINEIVAEVRADLGLSGTAQPGAVSVISAHVQALVQGRAQASEQSERLAVHHAANMVTMHTGQLVYDAEDVNIDGAGMDFLFRRIYKSQGYNNGPLGINWDHNYNHALRVLAGEQKIVRLTGGFQESAYQWQIQHNYWIAPPGDHSIIFDRADALPTGVTHLALPLNTHEYRYLLRLPDGTIYLYRQETNDPLTHRLYQVSDRYGNQLRFEYEQGAAVSSRIRRVLINSTHRTVSFKYDTHDRITLLVDHMGRKWQYRYDDQGDLVSFTSPATNRYPGGLTERYVYSTADRTGELRHNLLQVYDSAGQLYLENWYGEDKGELNFNRVVSQREGHGERWFEYEDVSLVGGTPAGQSALKEAYPVQQTTMVQRNGHPVHYIYNEYGNLIAREEDSWVSGLRSRLISHFRYNRDGALVAEISPEGRESLVLTGRDQFLLDHAAENLTASSDLRQHQAMSWQTRLGFGRRLAVVHRRQRSAFPGFQYPIPFSSLSSTGSEDIIVKMSYEPIFGNVLTVSDPRYTQSPFANSPLDNNTDFQRTLTRFEYKENGRLLAKIVYPDTTRDKQLDISGIQESFVEHDANGRLLVHEDRAGIRKRFVYHPAADGAQEGYLKTQTIDPITAVNPHGLDIKSERTVNNAGVLTKLELPKNQAITFEVDALNRVTRAVRGLPARQLPDPVTGQTLPKPAVAYETRYTYCRNMLVEQVERDVQDDAGRPLYGGTEVQFYHYDENNNVVRQSRGGANFEEHLVTHYHYDDGDLHVRTVQPRGNIVRTSYDERRLPYMQIRGAGTAVETEVRVGYNGDGLISEQVDGRGQKTTFGYDSFSRVVIVSELDKAGKPYRLIRYDYDKVGNRTVERLFVPDGGGDFELLYHASHLYNELNQRVETRVRRLSVPIPYTRAKVNKENDYISDAEAVRTLVYYDAGSRVTRIEKIGRRMDIGGNLEQADTVLAWQFAYNAAGWLISEIDPLGNRTDTQYDKHGLIKRVDLREQVGSQSPTGEEVFTLLYGYDELDRLSSIMDGLGNSTHFEYDSRDTMIREVDALGNITHFEYDVFGNRLSERLEMTESGLGGGNRQPNSDIVTRFEYDTNGNLVKLIDANGNETGQKVDALDRRTVLRCADGSASTFRYDGGDNVIWHQDNNGLIRRMRYGRLDNLLRMTVDTSQLAPSAVVEGATFEDFEHDPCGRMTRARNDWSDIQAKIDWLGRVVEEKTTIAGHAPNVTIKRDFDDFGFLRRLTYSDGRIIIYTPDKLNRIVRVENVALGASYPGPANKPAGYLLWENEYRGLRLGARKFGGGAAVSFDYDGAGRVIHIRHSDAQDGELLTIEHLYDASGNMRWKREYTPDGNYGEHYKYDSRAQLTAVEPAQNAPTNADRLLLVALRPANAPPQANLLNGQKAVIDPLLGPLAQQSGQFTYRYDKLGNRLEEREPGQPPIVYATNQLNQIASRGALQFQYDANGSRQLETGGAVPRRFIYDHRGQLVRVSEGADIARYHYDALGRRIWLEENGLIALGIYDNDNLIETWQVSSPSTAPQQIIQIVNEFEIDSRFHVATAGEEYWYHKDLVGSSRLLSDLAGTVAQNATGQLLRYRYTPFGVLIPPAPDPVQPFLFAGRWFDDALASYDFNARQYAPESGAFLQRDPADETIQVHEYLYASNSPLTRIDPAGINDRPVTVPRIQLKKLGPVNKGLTALRQAIAIVEQHVRIGSNTELAIEVRASGQIFLRAGDAAEVPISNPARLVDAIHSHGIGIGAPFASDADISVFRQMKSGARQIYHKYGRSLVHIMKGGGLELLVEDTAGKTVFYKSYQNLDEYAAHMKKLGLEFDVNVARGLKSHAFTPLRRSAGSSTMRSLTSFGKTAAHSFMVWGGYVMMLNQVRLMEKERRARNVVKNPDGLTEAERKDRLADTVAAQNPTMGAVLESMQYSPNAVAGFITEMVIGWNPHKSLVRDPVVEKYWRAKMDAQRQNDPTWSSHRRIYPAR